jgi:hypothetical protein
MAVRWKITRILLGAGFGQSRGKTIEAISSPAAEERGAGVGGEWQARLEWGSTDGGTIIAAEKTAFDLVGKPLKAYRQRQRPGGRG